MAAEDINPDIPPYLPHSQEDSTRSVDDVAQELGKLEERSSRRQIKVAIGLGLTAVGLVIGEFMTQRYGAGRLSHTLPFLPTAQNAINHIDDALVPVGEYGIPAAIGLVAGVKAWSPFNNLARFADVFSGREPNADNSSPKYSFGGLVHKLGSVSMALTGAALATFTAGVATEVGNGPDRALNTFDSLVPGSSVVVEYPKAMPMVESAVNPELVTRIREIASGDNIATHPFALNLGTYEFNRSSNTYLIAGIETKPGTPLDWDGKCKDVRVIIDSASGAHTGSRLSMNGVSVIVAGTTEGKSSMNRVSGVININALNTCLEQDPNKPPYGLTIETDLATAQLILNEARRETGSTAPAVVITKNQERLNSEVFWNANVKPITGVLSLAAMGLSAMAMASSMGSRLVRNRRELGARIASGVSINTLRFAETLRATKDGIVAGVGGAIVGVPLAIIPNAIQQGFDAGAGLREASVGMAVGLIGSVGGALLKLVFLRRIADPKETTRI